ncbi:hypothetical protein GGR56DRAFT_678299 [Xylariaceae sp. FL0804]|nr:hypothetical protein GGR56DRAFT_678299 [Xylariaceae sp. FL0804]
MTDALDQSKIPTVAKVTTFLQASFPMRQGDTRFDYHTPRSFKFSAHTCVASHAILSITPTPGFYDALAASKSPTPVAFLHRPWQLDRRRVPRHATVLSCHKGFDEVLTVGNNVALASVLGVDTRRSTVIRGYKGDPDRTIGIVGPVPGVPRAKLLKVITAEFPEVEGAFGFDDDAERELMVNSKRDIEAVAIMNAFHPDEVDRVATAAQAMGHLSSSWDCGKILYLTGAVRERGLQDAKERDMAVVCVGHRPCEEWGIRYLAQLLRHKWPSMNVDVILEDESMGTVNEGRPAN